MATKSKPKAADEVIELPTSRIVEMKLPLPWIVSTVVGAFVSLGAVLFQIHDATNGIADLKQAVTEIRLSQEKRDDKLQQVSQSNVETRATLANVQQDLTRLASEVGDLRRDQTDLRNRILKGR